MSIDYRAYVGPYVRCAVDFVPITATKRGCTNSGCVRYGDPITADYCQYCGNPAGDVSYTEDGPAIDQWGVCETLQGRLYGPGGDGYLRWIEEQHAHLYLPNIAFCERETSFEDYDFRLIDLPLSAIQAEELAFMVTFDQDIQTLRERYGADNVRVLWGIVQDYS